MKREFAGMNEAAWREACERGYEIPKAQAHQLVVELFDALAEHSKSDTSEHAFNLAHALSVVLPMVRAYAAEHRVGRNGEIAEWAGDVLQDWVDAGLCRVDRGL